MLKSTKHCNKMANKIESELSGGRLGKCEVCAATDARYSCPKCEVKTCSLRCVVIHKKELSCDGQRDRTKYIPLRKMTKMDFMNDYYFLEECTRFTQDRKTNRIKQCTRYNKVLPRHLFRLRKACIEREITLRFLLQNFTRHKENTTYLNWNDNKLYWRVEWIFANACNMRYVDERCPEDLPLYQLLDKYVNPNSVEEVLQKKALEYYQSFGVFQLKVLLKAEGIKRSRTRFYALDVAKTLRENLVNKTVVEFPCVYVSYESQPVGFDIIDSDNDVVSESKRYETVLEEERVKQIAAKRKKHNPDKDDDDTCDIDAKNKKLKTKAEKGKRRAERRRELEEIEKAPSNYLFTDERLWDTLSSSENDDGNDTTEEKGAST